VKDNKAETVSKAFQKVLDRMPQKPTICQSDNGSEFATLKEDYPDIKFVRSSAHLPQANGMIERVHRFLKSYLHFSQEKKKLPYPEQLQRIVKIYNERKHSITRTAPTELNKTDLTKEEKDNIVERITKASKKHNPHDGVFEKLEVGDYVRLAIMRKSKIEHMYQMWSDEVYVITMARKDDTYRVKNQDGVEMKYIYQRDYLQQIPKEVGEKIIKKQEDMTAKRKEEMETKRLQEEEQRQIKYQAKLVNEENKRAEYKFNVKDTLIFPKVFFEKYDKDSDDKPMKRTGIITNRRKVKTTAGTNENAYYVRFIDADYVGNKKLYPYFAENVEEYAENKKIAEKK
jgi:hypothetical protein